MLILSLGNMKHNRPKRKRRYQLNVEVSAALLRRIRREADKRNLAIRVVVAEALSEYFGEAAGISTNTEDEDAA